MTLTLRHVLPWAWRILRFPRNLVGGFEPPPTTFQTWNVLQHGNIFWISKRLSYSSTLWPFLHHQNNWRQSCGVCWHYSNSRYGASLGPPWWPLRQNIASSYPMAASSSFQCSPGHAASGDVTCIASTPPHGHQNGQQLRCICLLPLPFLLGVILVKDHVTGHYS